MAVLATDADGSCVELRSTPPKSPDLNPICERFLGSARRERLDHILILNEEHLQRVLHEYVDERFNVARPHQGIAQPAPLARSVAHRYVSNDVGKVVTIPILGGLHHDYRRAA